MLELRPAGGPPVLVAVFRYFFQREVERNQELFQGLAYGRLEAIQAGQAVGFAALEQHADRLAGLMEDVAAAVERTHLDVLDIKAELSRQGRQMQELGQAVLQALAGHQLEKRELHGSDSLSVRDEDERRLVRDLVRRYRALPPAERREMPALLNAVGKLQVVAGDFESAEKDFKEVAALVDDPRARAEAAHNAYRAALERRAWDDALTAIREATTLDGPRFAPFPGEKYEAEKILGAGGFGVAFLCRNRLTGGKVVIKTLRKDSLDRELSDIFREAQALEGLSHPAIIRLRDCDFADAGKKRPYFVMDYFAGHSLDEYVEQFGPLRPDELLPLAKLVASGLQKAHDGKVLHRDVKPGNLLVSRSGPGWEAKLIDFGLALRAEAASSTAKASLDRTLAGTSIAGTLDYAAPEQLGKVRGVPVGTYSDVYGFGKTCCYALFGTPSPTYQHWQQLPRELADLLGRCLSDQPRGRPQTFTEVLRELERMGPSRQAAAAIPVPMRMLEALPVEEPRRAEPRRQRVERLPEVEEEEAPRRGGGGGGVAVVVAIGITFGLGLTVFLGFALLRTDPSPPPVPIPDVLPKMRPPFEKVAVPPGAPIGFPGGGFPPEVRLPPKPYTEEELTKVIESLRSSKGVPIPTLVNYAQRLADTDPTPDMKKRHEAYKALQGAEAAPKEKVDATRRDDDIHAVSKALDPLFGKEQNYLIRVNGVRACQKWGTEHNVPELVELVNGQEGGIFYFRINCIRALAAIKDPRGVEPAAKRLTDPYDIKLGAVEALKRFGPMVEDEMVKYVSDPKQSAETRQAALDVLAAVGTVKSALALSDLAARTPEMKAAITTTQQAIEKRTKE